MALLSWTLNARFNEVPMDCESTTEVLGMKARSCKIGAFRRLYVDKGIPLG